MRRQAKGALVSLGLPSRARNGYYSEYMHALKLHQKLIDIVRTVLDYGFILVGSVILAANVPQFLEPNQVVSTGITGIGMLGAICGVGPSVW